MIIDFIRGIFIKPKLNNIAHKIVYTVWLFLAVFFGLFIVFSGFSSSAGDSSFGMVFFGTGGIVIITLIRNILLEVWN